MASMDPSAIRSLVPSELNPPLNHTLITSPDQFPALQDFFARKQVFAIDTETNVVEDFTERKIRTIQIGDKEEQYTIDLLAFAGSPEALRDGQGSRTPSEWAQPLVGLLQPVLDSNKWLKVGVNLDFDYKVLRWCLGLRLWNVYDCYLAEKCIYAGKVNFFAKDFWGLKDLVAKYCKLAIDKSAQTSFDLENILTTEQCAYCALDCRLSMAIMQGQKLPVTQLGLVGVVQIENDALPAFGEMYLNGIYLDWEAWMEVVAEVTIRHKENVKRLDNLFGTVVGWTQEMKPEPPSELRLKLLEERWRNEKDRVKRAEYRKDYQSLNSTGKAIKEWEKKASECEGEAFINYSSNPQLLDALRKMGFGPRALPSTEDYYLNQLSDKPVIAAIQAFRETKTALERYGENWRAFVNPCTGRVHSKINQIGAATGRTSSTNPNIQNIPKGSDYRGCFRSRPGYTFVSVDMAGAELRILAELSGEPLMVDAFRLGKDVHSIGAELIFGDQWKNSAEPECAYYFTADKQKCKCKVHKALRDRVKALGFGIIYGKEAKSFSEEMGISKADAQKILDKWRATYATAWKFLTELGNTTKMTFAVRSFSGRIEHFPKVDWDKCKEKARDRAKKDGKNPDHVSSRDIHRVYQGQLGNIERQGKNMPHQGGNVDVAKIAMSAGCDQNGEPFMYHQIRRFDAALVGFVHDEFDAEVRNDQVEEFVAMVGSCIKRAGAMLMGKVEMEYEALVGDRWRK